MEEKRRYTGLWWSYFPTARTLYQTTKTAWICETLPKPASCETGRRRELGKILSWIGDEALGRRWRKMKGSGREKATEVYRHFYFYYFVRAKQWSNKLKRTIERRSVERFFHSSIKDRLCNPRDRHMPSQQLVLPLTLHSISPTLSAIHINRARRLSRFGGEEGGEESEQPIGDLANTHCPRCGRFQLDGSADTRLVRDNKSRSTVVISQKTCRSCRFTQRSPLVKGGAAVFQNQRIRKRNRQNSNLKPTVSQTGMEGETQSVPGTQSLPVVSAAQPSQVQEPTASTSEGPRKSKSRKGRSGLQEMLERKRKQDEAKSSGTTLASFLQGL